MAQKSHYDIIMSLLLMMSLNKLISSNAKRPIHDHVFPQSEKYFNYGYVDESSFYLFCKYLRICRLAPSPHSPSFFNKYRENTPIKAIFKPINR